MTGRPRADGSGAWQPAYVEALLYPYRACIGADHDGYRNHVCRALRL